MTLSEEPCICYLETCKLQPASTDFRSLGLNNMNRPGTQALTYLFVGNIIGKHLQSAFFQSRLVSL